MATTEINEFEAAFGEETPAAAVMGEDEAFGILPDSVESGEVAVPAEGEAAVAEAVVEEAQDPVAAEVASPEASEPAAQTPGEQEAMAASDAPAGEQPMGGEAELGLDDLSDVPAEELQKAKSWQGRLKKIEAELKEALAKASAAPTGEPAVDGGAEALEQVADAAEAQGDPEMAETVEQVAEQVDSGEMDVAEAMNMLAADFGEPFVKMIEAVARRFAGEAAGKAVEEKLAPVSKNVDEVISHLKSSAERAHFKEIAGSHPDFLEIGQSPEFNDWVAGKGEDGQRIKDSGSAEEIVALLDEYKAQRAPAVDATAVDPQAAAPAKATPAQDAVAAAQDAVPEDEIDAAAGVRSAAGGMRLPEKPVDEDYAAAWDKF
jgi:hypothetical protein